MSQNPQDSNASQTIERLGILDRAGDPALRAIARLAGYVAGGSAAGVHILDERVQHRIAGHNAPEAGHPREDAMCSVVVDQGERVTSTDATDDERFAHSTFVQGDDPGVRMYLSTPLRMNDGAVVGTLCAWNSASSQLTDEQVEAFDDLALLAQTVLQGTGTDAAAA